MFVCVNMQHGNFLARVRGIEVNSVHVFYTQNLSILLTRCYFFYYSLAYGLFFERTIVFIFIFFLK